MRWGLSPGLLEKSVNHRSWPSTLFIWKTISESMLSSRSVTAWCIIRCIWHKAAKYGEVSYVDAMLWRIIKLGTDSSYVYGMNIYWTRSAIRWSWLQKMLLSRLVCKRMLIRSIHVQCLCLTSTIPIWNAGINPGYTCGAVSTRKAWFVDTDASRCPMHFKVDSGSELSCFLGFPEVLDVSIYDPTVI